MAARPPQGPEPGEALTAVPLEEHQIRRYARQILLRDVGGQGQQALLDGGAVATGEGGMAESVALAYLAAGGSPVRVRPHRRVSPAEAGFLFGAQDAGRPAAFALEAALQDLNPDAARSPPSAGLLAELPAPLDAPPPWVMMGWTRDGRGGLVYRTAEGCAACFAQSARGLDSTSPSPGASVALGALGALAFQRCLLGISEPLGGLWLEESGAVRPLQLTRCGPHA